MKKHRNNMPMRNRLCRDRQAERASVEEKLRTARAEIEKWSAQRAESQARLDELKSRLENLQSRLDSADKAIEIAEVHAREADEKHAQARQVREAAEAGLSAGRRRMKNAEKECVEELENERRAKSEERAQHLAEHTRLKAQLEVLEQAEQSLAGYAEGARFLLDAARQSRLKGHAAR